MGLMAQFESYASRLGIRKRESVRGVGMNYYISSIELRIGFNIGLL